MVDRERMQRIADAHPKVSDKIRALHREGLNRAEIARLLGKRYQHVRNVLEYDKLRANENTASSPTSKPDQPINAEALPNNGELPTSVTVASNRPAAFFRLVVDKDGGLVLPRHVLEAFGAGPGDVLVGVAKAGELVLQTAAASVSRAQELVRELIPGDDSLADSLIEDRRREVEDERLHG